MNEVKASATARAQAVKRWGAGDQTGFQLAFGQCDSPIEQAYCLALFQLPGVRSVGGCFDHSLLPGLYGRAPVITVFAQQPVLAYRADFLLVGTSPRYAEPMFVVVECDGEAFHSEREQRRRDAARQRALSNCGFKIIRFSGSELFRNPRNVAERTLAEFASHGWPTALAGMMVNNRLLRDALDELRRLAA
jgi:very-short-patch-repair endonuclease